MNKLAARGHTVICATSYVDTFMIDGFQNVKKEFLKTDKIPDFRTAAFKAAIEKIALSYDFIGL